MCASPHINLQRLKDKIATACDQLTADPITASTNKELMRLCFEPQFEPFTV
jgi:hypothetical protein